MMNIISILLQTQTGSIESFQPQVESQLSFLELAVKGGWIMIVILAFSVIAAYIFFERYYVISKALKKDNDFINRIRDYIHDEKIESAIALCDASNNPASRMVKKGIQHFGRPLSDIKTALESVAQLEINKLEKGLTGLATIAGAAPMVGFLGTVLGLVQAFYRMSMAGNNISVSLLADGIYMAMVTTIAGLLVGIPAFLAYNYLVSKVKHVVDYLETVSVDFMDILIEPVK
jgi:biopolymer transport protein ExbB